MNLPPATVRFASGADAVLDALVAAGYQAYYVGGCVRDRLRGLQPHHDVDVATDAPLADICRKFADTPVREVMYTPAQGEWVAEDATLDRAAARLPLLAGRISPACPRQFRQYQYAPRAFSPQIFSEKQRR